MPEMTERQAEAWEELVSPILLRHGISENLHGYYWDLTWEPERRRGRGHFLDAKFCDGEQYAQVRMDVYGYPTVAIAALEWTCVHGYELDDLECEICPPEVDE